MLCPVIELALNISHYTKFLESSTGFPDACKITIYVISGPTTNGSITTGI